MPSDSRPYCATTMTSETGVFAAAVCFLLAALYTAFQLARLIFPVWGWRWEKNAIESADLLERAAPYATARQIAESAPAPSCFNRLMKEKEIAPVERPFQVRFRRRILVAVVCAGILAYVRFTGKFPIEAPLLAADAVFVAVGMMFGELARYRIWRTQLHTAQMLSAIEVKKERTEKKNAAAASPDENTPQENAAGREQ